MGSFFQTDMNGLGSSVETPVARTLYVDGGRTDTYTETGSFERPYKTVQAAIDQAETMSPAYDSPVVIRIAPLEDKVYRETAVVKRDGIGLVGLTSGWGGQTGIERVIVTNATSASLQAFIAAGGLTDPGTHYGLLVQDVYEPWAFQMKDLNLGDMDTYTDNALMYLGVGAGNATASYEFDATTVYVFGTTYMRSVCIAYFYNETWLDDDVTAHNVGYLGFDGSGGFVSDFYASRDSGDDLPGFGGNVVLAGNGVSVIGSVIVSGEAALGGNGFLAGLYINANLEVYDTATATLKDSYVERDITVAGDAQLDLYGVHVQGNMTFDNTGGAVACTMDGGRYMGSLTDTGARLTRNVGN